MSLAQQIMDKIASYQDQMIEAQRELVAIPALGPTNRGEGESKKAKAVMDWLTGLDLEVEQVDAPDERVPDGVRPNLVAVLPGGEGPRRWVLSHLDVVPTGSLELWGGDPWKLRVEGDKLYGRGVLDDHAGLVPSFFALKALKELGVTPPGPACLVVVSDEETGSQYGLDYLLKTRPELISPQDLVVVPDGGEADGGLIEVAEKSILWLKVEVIGRQVHGSMPQKGVNALYVSARMMVATREMMERFPPNDPLFDPPYSTFEPTRKEAGVDNINTVPGRDVFYIDSRVMPGIPLDEVLAAFRQRFGQIAAEEGATVEITPEQKLQSAPSTPADAPVVRSLARAIKQARGVEARPGGIGGGTVAAYFRQRGIPAAVWVSWPDAAHIPDEYCLISDLVKDAQVFGLFFAGLPE